MKMQSLIIHDLCTTGSCSYFICGTKWTCTQPPFTEWEHKLQQHLSQVVVHMVAIRSIKQKQNFQHLLKHKKTLIVQRVIHILCNEVKNQLLSGLSSLQTPPSIATDCPATAPGGSLEMWVLALPSCADMYPTHMLSVVWLHRNSTSKVGFSCEDWGSAEHLQERRTITPPSTPSSLARKGEPINLFCIVSRRAWWASSVCKAHEHSLASMVLTRCSPQQQ